MRLTINGRNIEITQALRDYVEEKIGKVVNHYDQIMEIVVTLAVNKNPSVRESQMAEVDCFLNGAKLHVEEHSETMYASIDLLADKLDRQVKKHKERLVKGNHHRGSIRTAASEEMEGVAEEETSLEEAIEDIEE